MQDLAIPELDALHSPTSIIRIPPELDVPVTSRVMKLVDTTAFRRLKSISQLGLVSQVYPGATHSRFEHSLGVYRNGLLFLKRLASMPEFRKAISEADAQLLIVAGLLHDLGHWPFCHLIEDMRLEGVASHEHVARQFLLNSEIADVLERDWGIEADAIAELLSPTNPKQPHYPLLGSILSGPIDIDKLDYLDRDSLHAGVPYGRNFDRNRLVSQLCLGPDSKSLAITDKARTAAEMMVFARYVMFSEVYWHHAVRSATSMLQRVIWELLRNARVQAEGGGLLLNSWQSMGDSEFIQKIREYASNSNVAPIVEGLFGSKRVLYKRLAEFHSLESPELHAALARRPYIELVEIGNRLAERLAKEAKMEIRPTEVLIDAPPTKLEVQFNVHVKQSSGAFLPLGDLSPVAKTLASQQFDSLVKRVRIFVAPALRDRLRSIDLLSCIQSVLEK
ncbi:MAG: HD domain-containing protein [Pirellulaceae bacterium]|nr:HD domain-containing protein [Pirellulaceae bacterium]